MFFEVNTPLNILLFQTKKADRTAIGDLLKKKKKVVIPESKESFEGKLYCLSYFHVQFL